MSELLITYDTLCDSIWEFGILICILIFNFLMASKSSLSSNYDAWLRTDVPLEIWMLLDIELFFSSNFVRSIPIKPRGFRTKLCFLLCGTRHTFDVYTEVILITKTEVFDVDKLLRINLSGDLVLTRQLLSIVWQINSWQF